MIAPNGRRVLVKARARKMQHLQVVRHRLQRLVGLLDRGLGLVQVQQHLHPVAQARPVSRLARHRAVKVTQRRIGLAHGQPGAAAAVQRCRRARRQFRRAGKIGDGRRLILQLQPGNGAVVQGADKIGRQQQGAIKVLDRFLGVVERQQHVAAIVVGHGKLRHQGDGTVEILDGRRQVAQPPVGNAAIIQQAGAPVAGDVGGAEQLRERRPRLVEPAGREIIARLLRPKRRRRHGPGRPCRCGRQASANAPISARPCRIALPNPSWPVPLHAVRPRTLHPNRRSGSRKTGTFSRVGPGTDGEPPVAPKGSFVEACGGGRCEPIRAVRRGRPGALNALPRRRAEPVVLRRGSC